MSYEKQGFYSGQKLQASQLDAMEDGIIEAQELALEAALKGAQADYNENDSASASYIKNRPFYEEYAYEPITWDGEIGDREAVDVSHVFGDEVGAGTVFVVKLSDIILTTEDYIGSTMILSTSDGDQEVILNENHLISTEESTELGAYGQLSYISSVFDTDLASSVLGVNIQSTGTYSVLVPGTHLYTKSLSKIVVKRIDEKFLPELADAANMEKGAGEGSFQQVGDPSRVVDGKWDFNSDGNPRNPNAAADDAQFSGMQDYGATNKYSAIFGGSNRASGSRSFAINNRTIAAGDESFAQGYCTVAAGPSSFAGGSLTYAKGEASVALGGNTIAVGKASVALGEHSYAIGQDSFVAGDHCQATADMATAIGHQSKATAPVATAIGQYINAGYDHQVAVGRFNDNKENTIFEVGGGHADDNRLNVFEVYADGDVGIRFNGKTYSLQKMLASYFTDANLK